jgi:hypothetical protein
MSFGNNIKTEKYNEDRIQLIKLNLEHHIATGSPRLYEIQVDGMKAVPKTTDITQFSNYEIYLSDEIDELRIHLFQGTSHKYDGFVFKCNTQSVARINNLDGTNISVEEKVQQALQNKAFDDALKRLEQLELELNEAQDYIETLEDKLDKAEHKYFELLHTKPKINENAMQFLIQGFTMLAKKNPKALGKIPIIGELLEGGIEDSLADENELLQQELLAHKLKLQEMHGTNPSNEHSTFNATNNTEEI